MRRALSRALWLKYTLAASTAWLFGWGLFVLVGRAAWRVDRLPMAWGAVGLMAAGGVGWWLARRRVPAASTIRAALDQRARAGGLIMAADDDAGRGLPGSWADRVPAVIPAAVRYRGGRAWLLATAALAFVVVGFALPDRLAAIAGPDRLNVDEQVERLTGQLETLEAETLMERETADSLERQLERVAAESSATSPGRTLAALDAIERELERSAEAAASEAVREAERLQAVASAAEAAEAAAEAAEAGEGGRRADGEAGEKAAKELARRMGELARRIEAARAESEHLRSALPPDLAKPLEAMGELDDAALRELAELDAEAAEAMNELQEQMRAVAPDSLAWVDDAGSVHVLDPDQRTGAAELKDAKKKLANAHALRVGTGEVFEHDPEVMLLADLEGWGSGERIVALREIEGIACFKHQPTAKVARAKVDEAGGADVIHLVEPNGTVRRYELDGAASRAMQAAARGGMRGARRAAEAARRAAARGRGDMEAAMARMRAAGLLEGPAGRRLVAAMRAGRANQADANRPGRGGISRGRGDAPMTWRDPGAEETREMQSETLPTGAARSLDEAPTVGVSAAAPEDADPSVEVGTAALEGAAAGGGAAARQRVLPQHRAAVERYFERE